MNELIKEAIKKSFFEPVDVIDNDRSTSFNTFYKKDPSWFLVLIKSELDEEIKKVVAEQIDIVLPLIKISIEQFVSQQNLLLLTTEAIHRRTADDIRNAVYQVIQSFPR